MGHAYSKIKVVHPTSSATIDYGSLNPQGLYTTDTDYDLGIVRSLIRKGHLAPFYTGLNEPCQDFKKLAYETECPICFLYYPSTMNRTRCCDKSICTECFLQLRRSSTSPLVPAVCPFCVQPNLGVLYIPPEWSKHYVVFKKRRSDLFDREDCRHRRTWILEANDPDVVLVDTVRPKWENMLEERRSSAIGTTRRRRVQLTNAERRSRRRSSLTLSRYSSNDSSHTIYDTYANMDLEDILVMEAIRLSLVASQPTADATDPAIAASNSNTASN